MYATYLWIKTFHLILVMAWVAAVFYLPRLLIHLVEAGDDLAVRNRLLLMGRRLYRFGHIMAGLAILLGLTLWLGHYWWSGFPTLVTSGSGWMHAKLGLVTLLLTQYVIVGRWLKGVAAGRRLPSALTLRWVNEIPVLVLVLVVWLVLAKPF